MAKKIQAWAAFGPRLRPAPPVTPEELIDNLIAATNQSRGSVIGLLAELDTQIEAGLKAGRIVQLPNRTHYRPTAKRDGRVEINVRPSPDLEKRVNAGFLGQWINRENVGKTEADILAQWNAAHPIDPIES